MSPGRSEGTRNSQPHSSAISLSRWERVWGEGQSGNPEGRGGTNHTQTPPPVSPTARRSPSPMGEGWREGNVPDSDPGYVAPVKLMSPGRTEGTRNSQPHSSAISLSRWERAGVRVKAGIRGEWHETTPKHLHQSAPSSAIPLSQMGEGWGEGQSRNPRGRVAQPHPNTCTTSPTARRSPSPVGRGLG